MPHARSNAGSGSTLSEVVQPHVTIVHRYRRFTPRTGSSRRSMKRFCTRATGPPQHGHTIIAAEGMGLGEEDRDVIECAGWM